MSLCPLLLFSCLNLKKNTAHVLKFRDPDRGTNTVHVNSNLNGKKTLEWVLLPKPMNSNVTGVSLHGLQTQAYVFPPQVWGLPLTSTWRDLWKAESSLYALQKAGSQSPKSIGKTSRERSCWLSLSTKSKMKMACSTWKPHLWSEMPLQRLCPASSTTPPSLRRRGQSSPSQVSACL